MKNISADKLNIADALNEISLILWKQSKTPGGEYERGYCNGIKYARSLIVELKKDVLEGRNK